MPVEKLPGAHRFYQFQKVVNDGGGDAATREVIRQHIEKSGQDYCLETEGLNPVQALQKRAGLPETVAGYDLLAGAPV